MLYNKNSFSKTYSAKNSIQELPIADLYKAYVSAEDPSSKQQVLDDFAKTWALKKKPWFMAQLSAYFPKNFPAEKRDGLFNLAATLGSMNDFSKGCYWLAQDSTKSNYVGTMTKSPEYCSLVPTILGGYKKYANIPYSSWDPKSQKQGIHADLYACIQVPKEKYMTDLLHYAGQMELIPEGQEVSRFDLLRAVRSHLGAGADYRLSVAGTPYSTLPKLFRHIELQSWCAHPNVRTKYMILDLDNLDNMPEPLESSKIFNTEKDSDGDAPEWAL